MIALRCAGCGRAVDDALPFACPAAGDGRDHVLVRPGPPPGAAWPDSGEANPFVRYRALSHAWQVARARGLDDREVIAIVERLDAAVAAVDGHGFAITPYRAAPALAAVLGLAVPGGAWIKDETGNVAGSHKARHLFGLAVHLAVAERAGLTGAAERERPLAIASCGNAALAAAVVARAAGRALRVFIPPWADAAVVARLEALGAGLEVCPRRAGDPPGDPCHHRFRAAVAAGALPFSCQGPDNGLTLDGGMTLGFELADQEAALGAAPLDRLLVQVGGGALFSAVAQALAWAALLGRIPRRPALHAVQTAGGFPLVRGWRRVARRLAARLGGPAPGGDAAADRAAAAADAGCARWLAGHADHGAIDCAIAAAAADRAGTLWPWEIEPKSAATGILDDDTYDGLAIVRAMLETGGWPVIAAEDTIDRAHRLGRATGIAASPTGTAGLAGALELAAGGLLDAPERVAVLFTGVER